MLDRETINLCIKKFNVGEIPDFDFTNKETLQRSCEEIILWALWRRAVRKGRFRQEILNLFDKIKIEVEQENGK